jgi:hypothetical protein
MKISEYKNKQMGNHKFLFICLFAYSLIRLFVTPSVVHAQEVSLSITPPLTEISIIPGKTFAQTFTVSNNGTPVVIEPTIVPFVPLDENGHAEIVEDPNSVSIFSSWFSFDQTPYSLGENGNHDFIVKITPPEGTPEKDYYFTFLVETQNDNNLGVNNAQAKERIGANILMNVTKDVNPNKSGSIVEFFAPTLLDSFTGLTYKVQLGNSGDSFFKPVGKITVDQILGSTTTLNLAPLNILVGGTREISCLENQDLVPCKLPGKFLIGVYRSNLSFTVDGTGSTIEKQVYTIAFPFTIALGLVMIGISYGIIRKLAKYK